MQDSGITELTVIGSSPLSLADAKKHLRIIGLDADDAYIQLCIDSAEAILERRTMIALRRKTYRQTFPAFMYTGRNMQSLYLFRNPVVSISSFTMVDIDGTPQTVTNSQLRSSQWPATLCPIAGQYWPIAKYRTLEAIVVDFTAGYAFGKCPADMQLALRYLVSHLYENREFVIADSGAVPYALPYSLEALIKSFRYGGFV